MIILTDIFNMCRIYCRKYYESMSLMDTIDFFASLKKKDTINIEDTVFINPVY